MLARRTVSGVALAMATLSACSNSVAAINKNPHTGSGGATVVAGVQRVVITTGDDYRFHPSTIVVHPGRVRIELHNTARTGAPHNLLVSGFPADFVPLAYASKTSTATFTAPSPGRYRFVCTIHTAQGQTGVLVVKPGSGSS